MILRLAIASLRARALTVGLTILSIALSVTLFLGVEKIRIGAQQSFEGTISGTDLIFGARAGSVQLLLHTVFRIGTPTNNVTWESVQDVAARPEVAWVVPISLGDSHFQFRVMGTTAAFFDRFRYRGTQTLRFASGQAFDDLFDAVIGADVAAELGYHEGQPIVLSHGIASFVAHEDWPFRVSGILARTGTPLDRTVIVSLEGLEAIHVDWQGGGRRPGSPTPEAALRAMDLTPQSVTAALVGVESRLHIFQLQRWINGYRQEPLMAILPGVALSELWQIVGLAEIALRAVSAMVVITALFGMTASTFASLNERRREMAIWRANGGSPGTILGLLVLEAVLMGVIASLIGIALVHAVLFAIRPLIDSTFGLWLPIGWPGAQELMIVAVVIGTGALACLLPGWRAYRMSLADGMMVRT